MLELNKYIAEGKNKEEVINNLLKDANASLEEVYVDCKEEVSGTIFKSKKYKVSVILKQDVISYIKAYLKELTDLMGISVNFEVQKRENHIKINMISDNNSILIGKNGKTMSSLQLLVRQSVQNQIGEKINIILDASDYKEKQQKNIERLAIRLAKEVRKTKIEAKMDSMNSYERRLVHNVLTKFKGIITESTGEEPNRAVVIKPEEK